MKKLLFILAFSLLINVKATNNSTIVMDVDSGRVLYQNNAFEKKLIASTTKIMTFVVAYEYAKDFLDVYVEAGDEILKMYGTSIYISYHEKMLLRDLLYGLMLRSGNDAAIVIAYFVGGNEEGFVKLMNKKAKFLGMNNTVFNNSHGLDEKTQNYSTAYDMALLSSYANKIPFYRKVTSTKYYQVQTDNKYYSWTNRNKLLFTYPYLQSGKTGYTPKAGKTLVTSAEKNNLHLTIVSLNYYNHYDTQKLLYEDMFNKYYKKVILTKEEFRRQNKDLYIKNDLSYPLKKGEENDIDIKVVLGNTLEYNGEVIVTLKGKDIIHEKVYKKEIEKANYKSENFLIKIKDFFKKLF